MSKPISSKCLLNSALARSSDRARTASMFRAAAINFACRWYMVSATGLSPDGSTGASATSASSACRAKGHRTRPWEAMLEFHLRSEDAFDGRATSRSKSWYIGSRI